MNSRWSAQGSFLVSSSHTIQTGILPYAIPFPVPWDGPPNEAAGWTRFQVNPPPKYSLPESRYPEQSLPTTFRITCNTMHTIF